MKKLGTPIAELLRTPTNTLREVAHPKRVTVLGTG